jgi:regulator of replication initiation timing
MKHVRRSKLACHSSARRDRQAATRKRWRGAMQGVILFCLTTLFGSPASGQWEFDGRLAPQDTVEIRVSRWTALRGGVAEGSALSNTFTIGTAGTLDLPIIGQVPAAGLRASELEKLITDRLQARSGFHERPVTTVTTIRPNKHRSIDETGSAERSPAPDTGTTSAATDGSSAAASEHGHSEERAPVAHPGPAGLRAAAGLAATGQQKALERERSRADALLSELAAARMEADAARQELLAVREAARYQVLRYDQLLAAERQSTATLIQKLSAVRADLQQAKAELAQNARAASRARQVAQAGADKEHELAVRQRAKTAALEQKLLAAGREIDAFKSSATSSVEREEALRLELAAAREQLDARRQAANVASAQARANADKTAELELAREEQLQRIKGLVRDLRLARGEVDSLKAKAMFAMRDSGAWRAARHTAEAALAEAGRALDQEQRKVGLYERDLAQARQSIVALEARAKLDAAALAAGEAAEAAARRVGEALARERAKAVSDSQALNAVRQELDEAKEELSRLTSAQHKALDEERDRVSALSRDLTAARMEIDSLKTREARQTLDNMPKARAADRTRPRASQPARKTVRQVKARKPLRTVPLTRIVLPDALLPTKQPTGGSWR